jgi:hypothetical protein
MLWDYTHNRPRECSEAVDKAIHRAKKKYNLPRWFLYAVVHRESTFDPTKKFEDKCEGVRDIGVGLTQLTCPPNNGIPYPYGLDPPDNHDSRWINAKRINIFGEWIKMAHVSPMTDVDNPDQNLDRFHTVYAVPFYRYLKFKHPSDTDNERLRRLAFHWNKGLFAPFHPHDNTYMHDTTYLPEYDKYVNDYRPPVQSDDGVWDGNPGWFEVIFDDERRWADWSWGTRVDIVAATVSSPVFAGATSMAVTYNQAYAGLSLHHDGFNTTAYTHLKFVINPSGSNSVPEIDASLYDSTDKQIKPVVRIGPYSTTSSKDGWYQVSIPLAHLNGSNRIIKRVQLQDASKAAQPTFHIDDLKIVG